VTKLSVVLSTHAAGFDAVAFKGDFQANVAKIAGWGYDGVELAIRDPHLVDTSELERVVGGHGLAVPAIGCRSRAATPRCGRRRSSGSAATSRLRRG
jgi:sugar phosphate isomerase/epimerase